MIQQFLFLALGCGKCSVFQAGWNKFLTSKNVFLFCSLSTRPGPEIVSSTCDRWEHQQNKGARKGNFQTSVKVKWWILSSLKLFRTNQSNVKTIMVQSIYILVGGWTNPSEKYARQIGANFPKQGWKLKNWNHHPVYNIVKPPYCSLRPKKKLKSFALAEDFSCPTSTPACELAVVEA